jgi:flagellar hook-basal body complex protein FliE
MALIPPIGAGMPSVATTAPTRVGATESTSSSSSTGFGDAVGRALEDLEASQSKADSLARDAATGRLNNIEDYLMAASEAQLSTQLTVAVRNKAVEAFNEIMRMQI